jgi:hypothetical protein
LVCLDDSGTVLDAVVEWLFATAKPGDVIAIDAPLVVAWTPVQLAMSALR